MIPLFLILLELIRWYTQCPSCGRWLGLQLEQRDITREGYEEYLGRKLDAWDKKAWPGKTDTKPTPIYTYHFTSRYVCRYCGREHETNTYTLWLTLLKTGTFAVVRPMLPPTGEASPHIPAESSGAPATFWNRLSHGKKMFLIYSAILLVGFF